MTSTTIDIPADEQARWRTILADPVLSARVILGFEPWSKQADILRSVEEHKRTAVRSCNAAGKTAVAAATAATFLVRHQNSTVVTTAPTGRQVEELLWREIRKLHDRAENGATPAKWPLGGRCLTTKWEIAPDWFAIGYSADPTKTERFQGFHADHILFIVDEASGVAEPIYEAIQGSLVNDNAKILMIGNPTTASGEFGRAFSRNRGLYNTIHISAFDTPAFTGEPVSDTVLRGLTNQKGVNDILAYAGGEQSPIYQVRVLGEFPRYSDNTVVSLADVEAAMSRPAEMGEPRVLSCDVARFGCFDDQTELLTNEGWKPFPQVTGSERVYSRSPEGRGEWQPITKLHDYAYAGPMNLYDGARVNFCLTDNHNMLMGPNHYNRSIYDGPYDWRIRRFDECPTEFVVPRAAEWSGVDPGAFTFNASTVMPHGGHRIHTSHFSSREWFAFLGWFIAEGNVYQEKRANGRKRIMIAQNPGRKQDLLIGLLEAIGITARVTSTGRQLEFSNNLIGQHLIDECGVGAGQKRIPQYVMDATPGLIEEFLTTFCLGDGSFRDGQRQSYYTSSVTLADQIQELLVKIGRAGKVKRVTEAGSVAVIGGREITRLNHVYTVTETRESRNMTIAKRHVERVMYSGHVYCVSTPYRTIMVRRKGCVMWTGNSDKTVIALRRGNMVEILDAYNGRDTMETAGRVLRLGQEHRVLKAVIDDTGVGGGVTDRLRELGPGFNIDAYNAGAKPSEPSEYPNRRSEAWFTFASVIHDVSLPEDDELLGDLCAPLYKIDSQGRRVVESKDDTKKKLGRSPDRADAVLMLFNTHASTQARSVSDTSTIPAQQRDSARGGTIGATGSMGRNMATTGW